MEGVDLGGVPPQVDTSTAHSARVYDYWLGGKDNYAADRALADAIAGHVPTIRTMVREQRAFLSRTVRYLAAEAGVRQFLDIGTGIPTVGNVHEVAQAIAPEARVLYVDNDPMVLAHARAFMTSTDVGRTAYIDADLCEPQDILAHPTLQATLDLTQPVGLTLLGILMHLQETDDPYRIVNTLMQALPSGSYLALTHPTADFNAQAMAGVSGAAEQAGVNYVPRSRVQVERFFAGLELVEPGVVPMLAWRPDRQPPADPESAYAWVGVARKP